MKWFNKIRCYLGFHKWVCGHEPIPNPTRKCAHCQKQQKGSYDPMYGATDWK